MYSCTLILPIKCGREAVVINLSSKPQINIAMRRIITWTAIKLRNLFQCMKAHTSERICLHLSSRQNERSCQQRRFPIEFYTVHIKIIRKARTH